MSTPLHHRVLTFTVFWTLGLLWLGSVVHATESSLACPDWPTCFGSWTPEMTGGVFWEHGHRLVAGALILIFGAATALLWRPEADRPWVRRWALVGVGALLVQALLGGLTVILRLPTAVSTSHLALAFLFLALATVLALATGPAWRVGPMTDRDGVPVRRAGLGLAVLVLLQSVVGAGVRHADAGMACPDVPLCLGRVVPPLSNGYIALHFGHRVLGYAILVVAVALWWSLRRRGATRVLRGLATAALAAVATQVGLGFLSVYTRLGVAPVSLHTLVAATILTLAVAMTALTWTGWGEARAPAPGTEPAREVAGGR